MSNLLDAKIKSIFETNPGSFSRIEISVECPLDSGLMVTSVGVGEDGSIPLQFGGVKDFFLFVQSYRKNNPMEKFNRVSIVAEKSRIVDIAFLFDEELQKITMEDIR